VEASPSPEGDRLVAVPYQSFDAVSIIVGDVDVGMASTFWWLYKPKVDNRKGSEQIAFDSFPGAYSFPTPTLSPPRTRQKAAGSPECHTNP